MINDYRLEFLLTDEEASDIFRVLSNYIKSNKDKAPQLYREGLVDLLAPMIEEIVELADFAGEVINARMGIAADREVAAAAAAAEAEELPATPATPDLASSP